MTLHAKQPIGIFDSGVGGLTVVRAVMRALPSEQLVYLGDTARLPYGNRSLSTIVQYSRSAAQFLLKHDVKMILVACNTASAAALSVLESEMPVAVLGAVEPGAQSAVAVTQNQVIGVLATRATVRSQAYPLALQAWNPRARVVSLPCPLFVPLIEEGWSSAGDPVATAIADRYLRELHAQAPELDTLVLGCTHYPLLAEVIDKVAQTLWSHPVRLVDSALAMAQATHRRLEALGLLHPIEGAACTRSRLQCYVTDEAQVAEVGARFLGEPLQHLQVVDL